jgi:DNA-binding MarR family transcriptional regulator
MEKIVRDRSSSVKTGESNVLFDTWLTARSTIALLDSALAGTGLDAEASPCNVLHKAGETSPGELARWMSAPATTVSSHVKRMIARGHVLRVPHPEDGRSYRLTLTAAGRRAFTSAGRRFLPALAAVEAALTMPAADVQRALEALRAAIDAAGKEA